jgi:two-component system NtrC family sensor kinase
MKILNHVLPLLRRGDGEPKAADAARYGRIWRNTVILTLVVALLPLSVMTGLNYFLFRRSLRAEIRYDISRNLSSTASSLEFIVQERLAALRLLIQENSRADLDDRERLAAAFDNLRLSFGGFVDLGLVDADGDQRYYVGPYNLQGVNYADQTWFREVTVRGVHVSEVFLGYRQFPHFVIAVRRELGPDSFFILRATVDMALINRQVSLPNMARADDVFIINHAGILQTTSRSHGELLQPASVTVPIYAQGPTVIDRRDEGGEDYTLGYAYIENTPFILMIVKTPFAVGREWIRSRAELIAFFVFSALGIIAVVLWSATALVRQIMTADAQQARVLHNAEYTNKMATIGRLAASVAHEINNPLAIINEKAGLLQDITAAEEAMPHRDRIDAAAASILRSVDRCSAVTHRLLGFTRRMETRLEEIVLAEVLDEVLGFLGKEASHRNVTLVKDYEEGLPAVTCDRGQLQQIFLNIVNNAFAAVSEGGRIDIGVRRTRPGWQAVSVRDDGQGIAPDDLPRVFEPFFSTKGQFGTGLGLSITYGLVQKFGGRIEVESELGAGACFTVHLPERSPGTMG